MQGHITIRVGLESVAVRNCHTAQHHMIPFRERVHIKTLADTNTHNMLSSSPNWQAR